MVKVASRRGEIVAKVTLTDRVDVGVVFMNPTAKIPGYKVCAVKVEKAA
jgi:formylmethanofuran dehydrogenase subunit D